MRDKTHLKIRPNWVIMARGRSSVEAISRQVSLTFVQRLDKNDLRDEILPVPSSRPAPTPAPPPSVNPCSATFIARTGEGKARRREGALCAPSLRSLHPPPPQKAYAVNVASLRGRGRRDGVFEAPDRTRASLHSSHESEWRQSATQPMKIFTFEAFFSKSLLMAQNSG